MISLGQHQQHTTSFRHAFDSSCCVKPLAWFINPMDLRIRCFSLALSGAPNMAIREVLIFSLTVIYLTSLAAADSIQGCGGFVEVDPLNLSLTSSVCLCFISCPLGCRETVPRNKKYQNFGFD